MKHGGDNLIYRKKEAHRREMIEIQKERIGLAKYITALSLGVSTGIYIFIGATIGGVAENIADDATFAGPLISFLNANPYTVILICALVLFLITTVMGVVVILNHIKNWGNADKPYDGREWSMIAFALAGIWALLTYLFVILWDAAIVPIATYSQIVLASLAVICLLAMFIYLIFLIARVVQESLRIVILLIRLVCVLVKLMVQALIKKILPE